MTVATLMFFAATNSQQDGLWTKRIDDSTTLTLAAVHGMIDGEPRLWSPDGNENVDLETGALIAPMLNSFRKSGFELYFVAKRTAQSRGFSRIEDAVVFSGGHVVNSRGSSIQRKGTSIQLFSTSIPDQKANLKKANFSLRFMTEPDKVAEYDFEEKRWLLKPKGFIMDFYKLIETDLDGTKDVYTGVTGRRIGIGVWPESRPDPGLTPIAVLQDGLERRLHMEIDADSLEKVSNCRIVVDFGQQSWAPIRSFLLLRDAWTTVTFKDVPFHPMNHEM